MQGSINLHLTRLFNEYALDFPKGSTIQIVNFKRNKSATPFIFCLSLIFFFYGELKTVKQDVSRPLRLTASLGLCRCYAAFFHVSVCIKHLSFLVDSPCDKHVLHACMHAFFFRNENEYFGGDPIPSAQLYSIHIPAQSGQQSFWLLHTRRLSYLHFFSAEGFNIKFTTYVLQISVNSDEGLF